MSDNKNDKQVESVTSAPPLEPPTASALNKAIATCTQAVEALPREAQRRVLSAAAELLGLNQPASQPSRGASSQQRPPNGQQQRGARS